MIKLQDTIDYMISDDHKDRLLAEYYQVLARYYALKDILIRWDSLDFTPKCSRALLEEQANVMFQYLNILKIRLQVEDVINYTHVKED